jgi:archaellum biogenesis ATPase FlaH
MNDKVEGIRLDFNEKARIRSFLDIPNIITMEVPPVEYVVPALGIARNTITLWTGADGDGKTYLAQSMAIAIARGNQFLGMLCRQSPVLYIDLENAAYVVQDRLRSMSEDESIPELRVWGIWNEQQPPQFGSELLLTIGKETKPVIIIDPFRYFHTAEENDSTAMSAVMQYLRALAAYGCAVVMLHHPAKTEGSTGRGSSAIRGACDLALLHSLDRDSGLITLKVDKNRNGASRKITIQADFEDGRFELTDSPYITRRNDELAKLEAVITASPGISQNAICQQIAGRKNRLVRLLKEGTGTRWRTELGKHGSILYQPIGKSLFPKAGTGDTVTKNPSRNNLYRCFPPLGGNRIQVVDGQNERLCSVHGFHDQWLLNGEVYLCAKCDEHRNICLT